MSAVLNKDDLSAVGGALLKDTVRPAYNLGPQSLPRWRSLLGRAAASAIPVKLGMIGNSTTAGVGSNAGTTPFLAGSRTKSVPYLLAKSFTREGFQGGTENIFGDALMGSAAAYTTYDPRLTFATPSAWSTPIFSAGGGLFQNSTTTDAMTFTPTTATDKIDVYYVQNSGTATFTVKDNTTTLATVDSSGAPGLIKVSYTRTLSTNAINIARTGTGGTLYIAGIDTWNSASTLVRCWNMGAYGSTTALWVQTGAPYAALDALDVISPDLVIINSLDINDQATGVPASTFQTNMQTIITRRKAAGQSVLLVRGHPNQDQTQAALSPAYLAAYKALCDSNDVPFVDLTARFVSYAVRNAYGNYADGIHLFDTGYGDVTHAIFAAIRPQ